HVIAVTQRRPAARTLLSCLVAGVRGPRRCLPLEAALSESILLGAPGAEEEVLRVGREEGFENFLGVGTEEDDPFTVRTTLVVVMLGLVAPRPVLPHRTAHVDVGSAQFDDVLWTAAAEPLHFNHRADHFGHRGKDDLDMLDPDAPHARLLACQAFA